MADHDFERLRREILEADEAVVAALDRCGRAVRALVEARSADPDGYHPLPREAEVLALADRASGALPKPAVRAVLREVVVAAAGIEAPVSVAFIGPEGSLSHSCARARFGAGAKLVAFPSLGAVFEAVSKRSSSYGVVPLYSSVEGSYGPTLDALALEAAPSIIGEVMVPATYHLLSSSGNATEIEKIYAPAWILAACDRFLGDSFPKTSIVDVRSAALAGQLASEDRRAAAIATDVVADAYGLRYVQRSVEDSGVEIRFAVLGVDPSPRTAQDRTAAVFAVSDEPGSLYTALKPFAEQHINLTRIESRPARRMPWPYQFFIEMDGHMSDRPVVNAIEQVRRAARFLKVLGSFASS